MKMTLRALRVNKGLSAREVATMIGVKEVKTVYNWENGIHRVPHDAVVKLADIYGCDITLIDL